MTIHLLSFFLSLKVPSFCNVLSMLIWSSVTHLVECDPNTVMPTPAFFNTVTHHLEMVDVVMRLWGLTKLIKRFWSFRRSLVFQYTVQDDLPHRFPDLGILKAPLVPNDVLDVIVSIIPEQKLLPCLPRTSLSLCSYRTIFGLSDQL